MRVAVAQIDPKLAAKERNLDACLARLDEAVAEAAELLVLPECAISGYMFESAEEALPYAEEIPGPSTEALEEACSRTGAHVVCGLLERDGDRLHNTAVFVGPDGLVGSYRKTHLPFLGVDRFVTPGDDLPVWDTPLGRIGIEICYDLRFPEVTRTLALRGADIVCHPTNFPVAARVQTELITVAARAWPRRGRPTRCCWSPTWTSRRRETRTTWFRASTSSTSSATDDPSSTAPSSRRPKASRPRRRCP
jgi:predicted amidohydrolase